jgi:superfamily II DNA or RNA helicase
MIVQWKDELESKFGLTFDIIDRERVGELRRSRGFSVNPWTTGSRFLLAHSLLTDEVYVSGLRDILGEFRSRALFILDEAHHAAPSGGARYAISSQLTRSVSDLAHRFEHRLFLTATPHNGHSNSFSALLEMLDPQRFTRGVPVTPRDLDPVMVRRIKADLRRLGEAFPERRVERIVLANLPADTPELDLWRRLAAYGDLRNRRIAALPRHKAAQAKIAFVGLQQRLLSSVAAFARTLKAHRKTLEKLIEAENTEGSAAAQGFVDGTTTQMIDDFGLEEKEAEDAIEADEDATAEAATVAGAAEASQADLRKELAAADEMLVLAENAARRSDARVQWLIAWIKANLMTGGAGTIAVSSSSRNGRTLDGGWSAGCAKPLPIRIAQMSASVCSPAPPARTGARR